MDSNQQQYCLKWNHHQSNLLKVFSRLLGNEQFTDVLLATEGQTIRCHKVVLSACSSYFENLFMTFDEKNQIIILKDTSYDDILAIVDFMYRGEINVGQHQLASLLKTAENLKIKGLAEVTSSSSKGEGGNPGDSNRNSPASGNGNANGDHNGGSAASLIPTTPPKVTNAISSSSSNLSSALLNTGSINVGTPGLGGLPGGSDPTSPKKPKVSIEPAGSSPMTQTPLLLTPKEPRLTLLPQSQLKEPDRGQHEVLTPLIMKRKRGRPRILDAPGEVNPFAQTRLPEQDYPPRSTPGKPSNSNMQPSTSMDLVSSTNKIDHHDDSSNEPTPGGPLTMERIKEMGIIKMNDYLSTGTRQQFWEEYYVKVVMQAVRNKEIDMKTAAEILGVSYGTLYGRYRETFGYLKHAWNTGGRPSKPSSFSYRDGAPSMVPSSSILDAGSLHILEQLKYGKINIRQAAELLKVEPTILAYELAAKAADFSADFAADYGVDPNDRDPGDEPQIEDDDDDDYNDQMMEVQPDVVIHDDLADDDGEAEEEEEEPRQRMEHPDDNDHEERRRSHMEENRPLPQAGMSEGLKLAMQSMRPPPGGIPGGIPPPQHHILPMGTDRGGSAIKKEAEVDPIAATN